MTINRNVAAAYLATQYSTLAAAIGQTDSDDSVTGYGPDIDAALRKLGKTESALAAATVEDAQRDAFLGLSEFYAARRLFRQFGAFITTKVDDSQFDYKQAQANVKAMMDEAKAQCIALGYDVQGGGWTVGNLNLDWVEAEAAT